MDLSRIVILAVLVTLINAGPLHYKSEKTQKTCAIKCSESNKFNYQPGTTYEFSYDAKTTTKMNGASEDSATINMNAMIDIEPITKCDFVMRVKDASLRDSEDDQNSQAFKDAMMNQPLKFSFQDGRIDQICATDDEPTWILNIKRGILSAFQNSMDNFDRDQNVTETGVVGICDSEYKILDEGRRLMVVGKTKNLLECSERESYNMAVQSIRYNKPSFVKSFPLMKSEYKCTQTLDLGSNTLQSSSCSEEHVFRPFSYGKNGAMTSIDTELTLTNKRKAGPPSNDKFSRRSTLLFQHEYNSPSMRENEEKIEAKLQELCQKAVEEIRPEVPEMVNQLIEHMRQVDRNVLSRVYKKINQRNICAQSADRIKQYFYDAIPMVGTAASVAMIQDLISKKQVTGAEAEMWLLSLSFVQHPTKDMISAIMPLLDERDLSGNALLAISSLASSYCNVRPDCGKDYEISALTRKLMDLTHDCNTKDVDARKIIFALRAIGNIGHSHEAVSHLTRCFTRRDVNGEIRIAAMDAFRRIPCDAVRSDLMGVFRDESEDSELRLNAYIALMKCPSRQVLSEVRQVLEKEKSNQVGSFVWSHLTNLMETSDPHFQDIRNIVQDEQLKKEFNLDQRKFSRNYEGSFFFDSINTGAKVDSNVIFSEKSFVPRSANLNLTIDMFGHAINFLEFGGRVQGMEKILENFFRTNTGKDLKTKAKLPFNFDKTMDPFRASAYMRVFGNELRYWDDKSLNELQSSLQKLMRMQAISFSKTMVLLDSRMIIPTCVGLPLNLTMSSTGSVSLDAKASFQHGKIAMNLDLKPSASVQVKGEMSVDAHMSKAGLKMVTVAHTSTGASLDLGNGKFDLKIPKKKMEIFNLRTDFYIVHKNSEKKQKMIADNVKRHEICTGRMMKQVAGLTFCQSLQYPSVSHQNEAPFFPFTGPIDYDLYMMNEDAPNGYQIEAFSKKMAYSFSIDTPGSKTSRQIAIKTELKDTSELKISLINPWKNIHLEGSFVNSVDMKELSGRLSIGSISHYAFSAKLGSKSSSSSVTYLPQLEVSLPRTKLKYKGIVEIRGDKSFLLNMNAEGFTKDKISLKVSGENLDESLTLIIQMRNGKKEYYFDGHIGKSVTTSGFKYSPYLKISTPNKDLIEFTSEVIYVAAKRASLQFTLKNVFSKNIDLNAQLVHYSGKMKSKTSLLFAFKSPLGSCQLNGQSNVKETLWINELTLTYHLGNKFSDRLIMASKFNDTSTTTTARLVTDISLQSEKRPSLGFRVHGEFSNNDQQFEAKINSQHGDPKDKNQSRFNLFSLTKKSSDLYNYFISFQYNTQQMNYKVEASHVQSAKWPFKKFKNNVMVQMEPGKVVQTKISYSNAKVKGLPTYKGEVALSYPGRDMKMADKLTQVNKNTFENNFSVQWQKGQEITVQNTYTKTGKDIHNIENILQLPSKKQAKVSAMLQATSGDYKGKVQFSADENMISRQRINYMTEAGVTYNFNARQMSSDVKAEVMWAPNQKMSANINFDYTKMQSFNGKIVISTPFDAVKNFESQMKYTWANGKHNSMMFVSWNNKNELKNEFSFMYPDFQLSYDASLLLNGKKSEMALAMKYSDMSVNGNVKISHDEVTIFNVILIHNSQRMNNEGELGLGFDILDNSGKMKVSFKYDNRKDEFASNGEGKLNLSFRELRQIGASYNIKHNSDRSSIDMSFSSSLRNYGNGKMSIEMNRNLPKRIKATMDFTLNGNPMLNMNLNYGKQRDNIKVKADMTGPDGEKMTASGNINFSGSRKTANIELKSRKIEFNADGAFEYQGTNFISGEVQATLNRKTFRISCNYEKGRSFDLDGNLILSQGKTVVGKLNINTNDQFSFLFVVGSSGFDRLKSVDISFNKLSDSVSTVIKGHMEILPIMKRTEFSANLSRQEAVTLTVELKTPWRKVRHSKAEMSLRRESDRSRVIECEILLNEEQIIETKTHFALESFKNISVSFELKTAYQKFNNVFLSYRHTTDSSRVESDLDIILGHGTNFNLKLRNNASNSEMFLTTRIRDLCDYETLFIRRGNLNNLLMTVTHNQSGKETFKGRAHINLYQSFINVSLKYPSLAKFDLDLLWNKDDLSLNFSLNLALKTEIYKLFAAYEHLKRLKVVIRFPNFDRELLLTSENKVFVLKTNSPNYSAFLSFDANNQEIDAQLLKHHSQDFLSFNKKGNLKSMTIDAKYLRKGQISRLTFSNVNYYRRLNSNLTTPEQNVSIGFSLSGTKKEFNSILTVYLNNTIYEIKSSNMDYIRNINLELNAPTSKFIVHFMKEANSVLVKFFSLIGDKKYEFKFQKDSGFQMFLMLKNHKAVDIVYTNNSSKCDLKANADVLSGKFTLDACLSNQGDPKFEVNLKTPFNRTRNLHSVVSWKRNSMLDQKVKIDFSLNEQKPTEIELIYRLNSKQDFKVFFKTETLYNQFDGIKIDLKYYRQNIVVDSHLRLNFGHEMNFEAEVRNSLNTTDIFINSELKDHWNHGYTLNRLGLPDNMILKFSQRVYENEPLFGEIIVKYDDASSDIKTKFTIFDFVFQTELSTNSTLTSFHSILKEQEKELYSIDATYKHTRNLYFRFFLPSYYIEATMGYDQYLKTHSGDFKLKFASLIMSDKISQNSKATIEAAVESESIDFDKLKTAFELKGNFSYNAIKNMLRSSGSLKIMPYMETTEVEMKYTKKQISLEMKSKFESMKQAKITFMFDGDWVQSQSFKTVLQLNKEQLANLDITYNFNSINDFSINMAALTSHRRYKEFQFELKNQGPFSNMQSSLKLKLVNVLMIDAMFQNSRKVSKASIDAQILDFDEWKTTFELKGNLNFMTANIITSIAKQEVNRIEANIKEYGRMVNIKINGPRSVKFDFNMNLDTDRITFNMASTLTFDGRNKYEIFAAYEHLSKLQIKTSIPSYEDELSITFTGNLRAFNAQSKFSHNNNVYEMMLSNKEYYRQVKAILNTPYFQDTALFKVNGDLNEMNILAQVMHNKEKFELTFSNIGYYREINAKLDTPYFQPMLKFYLTGNLKKFNLGLKVEFNRQQFEMKASNEQYFKKMNFMLNTPTLNSSFRLNKTESYFHFSNSKSKLEVKIDTKDDLEFYFLLKNPSSFVDSKLDRTNDEIYKIVVTYEHLAKLYLKTWFPSYKDEMTLTLNGDLKTFNAVAKFNHNSNRYELIISNQGYYRKIDAQLVTPFFTDMASFIFNGDQETFNAQAKFMHFNQPDGNLDQISPYFQINSLLKFDQISKNYTMITNLTCCGKIYKLSIVNINDYQTFKIELNSSMNFLFKFNGDKRDFKLNTVFTYNGKHYELTLANADYYRKISATLSTPIVQQSLIFSMNGNQKDSSALEVRVSHNEKSFYLSVYNEKFYQDLGMTLITPFFHSNGSFTCTENFELKTELFYGNKHYQVFMDAQRNYRNANVKIKTPSFKTEASFSLEANEKIFAAAAKWSFNELFYRLSIERINSKFSTELITPLLKTDAFLILDLKQATFTFASQTTFKDTIYELKASSSNFYRNIQTKINFPSTQMDSSLNLEGDLRTFNAMAQTALNGQHYGINVANSEFYRKIWTKVTTPKLNDSLLFHLKGNLESFQTQLIFTHDNDSYKLQASNKDYYKDINLSVSSPHFNKSFSADLNGGLKAFNIRTLLSINNDQYELIISNKGYYQWISINLTTPFSEQSFSFSLNGQRDDFSLKAKVMYQKDEYELVVKGHYLEMWATLKTPSTRDTAIFSLKGKRHAFNISLNVSHNSFEYKVSMSVVRYYRRINLEVTTPLIQSEIVFNFEEEAKALKTRASLIFGSQRHNLAISNTGIYRNIDIKLSSPSLGNLSFALDSEVGFNSLLLQTAFSHNQKKYKLSVSSHDHIRKITAEISRPYLNNSFIFLLNGTLKEFDLRGTFDLNGEQYKLDISNQGYFEKISSHIELPTDSFSFLFEGRAQNFTFKALSLYKKAHYEFFVSSLGFYENFDINVTSPIFKFSAKSTLSRSFESIHALAKIEYYNGDHSKNLSNDDYFDALGREQDTPDFQTTKRSERSRKYQMNFDVYETSRLINLQILSPLVFLESMNFTSTRGPNNYNTTLNFKHNHNNYEIKVYNQDSNQINLKVNVPFVVCNFQFNASSEIVYGVLKIQTGDVKSELRIKGNAYSKVTEFRAFNTGKTMLIKSNIYYKKNSITGDLTGWVNGNKFRFNGAYKTIGQKKILKSDIESPYFTNSLHGSIVGTLRKFNANMKLQHNKNVYVLTASNKNFYKELFMNLKTPQSNFKFELDGNTQNSKISLSLKMVAGFYELNLSNQNYFRNINLELFTPQIGKCTYNLDFQGNWNNFGVESKLLFEKNKYELNVSLNNKIGEYKIKFDVPKININGKFIGNLESFSFGANAVSKNQKYGIMASMKNNFREISAKLTSPQFGRQILSTNFKGNLKGFNGFIEIRNNDKLYRSEFSLGKREFETRITLTGWQKELHVKFPMDRENIDGFLRFWNNGEIYEIDIARRESFKGYLAFPRWGSLNISADGNLQYGQTHLRAVWGENVFENTARISFDGNQLDLDIELSHKILNQSNRFNIHVGAINDKKIFKTELRVQSGDSQLNSKVTLKLLPHIDIVFSAQSQKFDDIEMKLFIVSDKLKKVNVVFNLQSPWTNTTKVFYEHQFIPGRHFSSNGYIERNQRRLAGRSAGGMLNKRRGFHFKWEFDNNTKIHSVKMDLELNAPLNSGVTNPLEILKEFQISAKFSPESLNTVLNLELKKQQMRLTLDLNSQGILLNSIIKEIGNKQVQFQLYYKNLDHGPDVSRDFSFRMIHPLRDTKGNFRYSNTQESIVTSGNMVWGDTRSERVGFELMLQNGREKEGKLRIITPRRISELFGKVEVNGQQYTAMGHLMMDENNKAQKIEIKADVNNSEDRADIDLTIKFPNQKKGMNLKTSINFPQGNTLFGCASEFSMDQDLQKTFKMSTKVMSESNGRRQAYTMQMDANHPRTGFAVDMMARLSSTPDKYNADLGIGYLTAKNKKEKIAIRGEMHKVNRQVSLKFEAPRKSLELVGSLSRERRCFVSIIKKETGKENMEAFFNFSPNSRKINIFFNYDQEHPDKIYRIYGEVAETRASLKAYRTNNKESELIKDLNIQAELEPHNILSSSIHWNPKIFEEFSVFKYKTLNHFGKQVNDFAGSFSEIFGDEVYFKLVLLRESMAEDLLQLREIFLENLDALSEDFAEAWREAKEMYERNYFYLKSGMETIDSFWKDLQFVYNQNMDFLRGKLDGFYNKMAASVYEAKRIFDKNYAQLQVFFTRESSRILTHCRIKTEKLYQSGMEFHFRIMKKLERYILTIKDILGQINQNLYRDEILNFLKSISKSMAEKTVKSKEYIKALMSVIDFTHSTIEHQIAKAKRYPFVNVVMNAANGLYQQMLWAYDHWEVKENILALRNSLYKFGLEKMKEAKDIITDVGMNTLVFDPKRGEIMIQIRFGAAKYAYNHFMSSVKDVEWAIEKFNNNIVPNTKTKILDIYHFMKPSTKIQDYLPPFQAEATLSAGHNITTFDGRHLAFKGNCSYLLAQDIVDGSFSVAINFVENQTVKSISLITAQNEHVDIFSNKKVLFNEDLAKLPLKLTDTQITQQGHMIFVESQRGYKVMYDPEIQRVTVEISGWYFNKMAGLFGNYNNEPSDDMTMSNNGQTNHLDKLFRSWSVSTQCESGNQKDPMHKLCSYFFRDNESPFQDCFHKVNSEPFYETCIKNEGLIEFSPIQKLCDVSSAYIKECKKKRIILQSPKTCRNNADKTQHRNQSI